MFLEKSKNRILKEFDDFCRELPGVSGEILQILEHVGDREALAMKYLYANMPYSDVGNYSFDMIRDYAAHGVFLWENSPYRDRMTEKMFLSDVLYHRVNEEEIKPCRSFFWNQVKELVQGRSMLEAVLEINYWCASEVTYQATDDRTSSAIDIYRCGFGRCGEESVFAVNVLRSAGIPARQVYVPKWSHCDDNHAWVEVWCDGIWHYIGACEPEAVPDRGWFTNAASRAMLVRSRRFERPAAGPAGWGIGLDGSFDAEAEKRLDMAERNGSEAEKMPEVTDLDGSSAKTEKMTGITEESDRFICREGIDVILNQLDRYARTRKITVQVTDTKGRAVPDAVVSMEVLNYAELSPIASIKADQNGCVSFVTGLGSLHIAACADGKYGECMADTRSEDHFCCVVGAEPAWDIWTDFDMAAPEETTNWERQDGRISDHSAQRSWEPQCETPRAGESTIQEECVRYAEKSGSWEKNETQMKENGVRLISPEQEKENDRRTEEAAKQCRIKRAQFKPEWEVYFSQHGEAEPSAKAGEADRGVPENVRKLLRVLTPKDRRDISPEVLLEHCGEVSDGLQSSQEQYQMEQNLSEHCERVSAGWQSSSEQYRMERDLSKRCSEALSSRDGLPHGDTCSGAGNCCREAYPKELFLPYVCSPRIENEVLTPWRRYILGFFTLGQQQVFRQNPEQIWNWIRKHIVSRDDRERLSIYTTPAAALKLGIAGEASQKILFTAIARTLGIPSRLNPADGEMEYWSGDSFVPVLSERKRTARLVITACEEDTSWIYFQNWSVAKMELSGYRSLSLQKLSRESEKNTAAEVEETEKNTATKTEGSEKNAAVKPGKSVIDLEPGRYRVLTANRLPTGDILARRYEFCLKEGQRKELELGLRKASLGDMLSSHNISSYFVRSREGAEISLSELTRGEKKILFWLDPGKEPTEHVLNELLERQQDFVGRQEQLLFLLPGAAALENGTFALCRKAFPGVKIFFDAFGKGMEMAARSMYVDPGKRPLLIVTEGEVHGIFAASGYSVGIVDMLLRILKKRAVLD